MKAFIIGASGLVGSHCQSYIGGLGNSVVGTYLNFQTEGTIHFDTENTDLDTFFTQLDFLPDVIIHCGALTNVDYCERNETESFQKTVAPTVKLVEYCLLNSIKLVYVSTDYVFDGNNGPYAENAQVNPINIYGRHKLECESLVSTLKDFLIVRITNVYGEEIRNKNFISRLLQDLSNNEDKTISLPIDQFATPIYAGDIARMIYVLLEDDKSGIYHLASTDLYNRFQLASKVKSYFPNNHLISLLPIKTAHSDQSAARPLLGGLLSSKFLSEYPTFELTNVDAFILKNLKHEL